MNLYFRHTCCYPTRLTSTFLFTTKALSVTQESNVLLDRSVVDLFSFAYPVLSYTDILNHNKTTTTGHKESYWSQLFSPFFFLSWRFDLIGLPSRLLGVPLPSSKFWKMHLWLSYSALDEKTDTTLISVQYIWSYSQETVSVKQRLETRGHSSPGSVQN